MLPKMNGTFAPATVSAAEVDFLDLLEKEEADFADQGGYSVVSCASHHRPDLIILMVYLS